MIPKELLGLLMLVKSASGYVDTALKDKNITRFILLNYGISPSKLRDYVSKIDKLSQGDGNSAGNIGIFLLSEILGYMHSSNEKVNKLVTFATKTSVDSKYLENLVLSDEDNAAIEAYLTGDESRAQEVSIRLKRYRNAVKYYESLFNMAESEVKSNDV